MHKRVLVQNSNSDLQMFFLVAPQAAESEQQQISLAEARKLNGRMLTQLRKNRRASDAWEQLCSLPSRGHSKNAKKRLFLFSWVDGLASDGMSWGPSFWEECTTLLGQELMGTSHRTPSAPQSQPRGILRQQTILVAFVSGFFLFLILASGWCFLAQCRPRVSL